MNKNTIRKFLNEEPSMSVGGGFSGRGATLSVVGDGSPISSNAAFVSDSGGYGVTDNAQFRTVVDPESGDIATPWAFRTAEAAVMRDIEHHMLHRNHYSPSYADGWRQMVIPIPRSLKDQQGTTESVFADLGFTREDIDCLKYLLMAYINARP